MPTRVKSSDEHNSSKQTDMVSVVIYSGNKKQKVSNQIHKIISISAKCYKEDKIE